MMNEMDFSSYIKNKFPVPTQLNLQLALGSATANTGPLDGDWRNRYKPGIVGYKFLHSKDIEYWLNGSVKLSRMSEYRPNELSQREIDDVKAGRPDPKEQQIICKEIFVDNPLDPKNEILMHNLAHIGGAKIFPGALDTIIEGVRITRKDRYIFCASSSACYSVIDGWKNTEEYDAYIEIADMLEFANRLSARDLFLDRLIGTGGNPSLDWVKYVDFETSEWLRHQKLHGYVFPKDHRFSWQEEFRLSWPLLENDQKFLTNEPQNYVINGLELSDLIKVVKL